MSNTNAKLSDQILENVNTVPMLSQHLPEQKDVDIATAPRKTVWEDGKAKLTTLSAKAKQKPKRHWSLRPRQPLRK